MFAFLTWVVLFFGPGKRHLFGNSFLVLLSKVEATPIHPPQGLIAFSPLQTAFSLAKELKFFMQ